MQTFVKHLLKKITRICFGDYSIYRIYSRSADDPPRAPSRTVTPFKVLPVDESTIESSLEPLIQEQAGYAGPGSHAYACYDGDRIVGICFYWFGSRYLKRNFWPLLDGEAKLVQIISLPDMRGRGIATMLIASSFDDMVDRKFRRAYARIWHSNVPSFRAFERAAWTRVGLVVEVNPLRRIQPVRIRFGFKSP